MIRLVATGKVEHCLTCDLVDEGVTPATACIAHRCDDHADLPAVNQEGPEGSECAGCVGQAFAAAWEAAFEKNVFWPLIQSARDRLNILAPGAGDQFEEQARAQINAAAIFDAPDEGETP